MGGYSRKLVILLVLTHPHVIFYVINGDLTNKVSVACKVNGTIPLYPLSTIFS